MVWDFLNPFLLPFVELNPGLAVIIFALVVSIINSIAYKYLTDQHVMKALKDDMKKMQEQIKKYKDNTEKMLEIQQKMLSKNKDYFMQSLRPTFVTMIPLLILFGWMNAHIAYEPINPGEEFIVQATVVEGLSELTLLPSEDLTVLGESTVAVVDKKAQWTLVAQEGSYDMTILSNSANVSRKVLVTDEFMYENPIRAYSGDIKKVEVLMERRILYDLGFVRLGFFWTYILGSLVFSIAIRRLLKLS